MKLILHIGTHKTGTTNFQRFCSSNQRMLLEKGLWYPKYSEVIEEFEDHYAHLDLAKGLMNQSKKFTSDDIEVFFKKLYQKAHLDKNIHTVLISSEPFFRGEIDDEDPWEAKKKYIKKLKTILPFDNIEICIVLRNHYEYLKSLYGEHILATNYGKDMNNFFIDYSTRFHYKENIELWEKYFKNIKILIFEDLKNDSRLSHNLLNNFGILLSDKIKEVKTNTSYDIYSIGLKKQLNALSMSTEKKELKPFYENISKNMKILENDNAKYLKELQLNNDFNIMVKKDIKYLESRCILLPDSFKEIKKINYVDFDLIETYCLNKDFNGLKKSFSSSKLTSRKIRSISDRVKGLLGDNDFYDFLASWIKNDLKSVPNELYFQFIKRNSSVKFLDKNENGILILNDIKISFLNDGINFDGSFVKNLLLNYIKYKRVFFYSPYNGEFCTALRNLDEDSYLFKDSLQNNFIVSFFGPKHLAKYDMQIFLVEENQMFYFSERTLSSEESFRNDLIFSKFTNVLKKISIGDYIENKHLNDIIVTNSIFPHIGHHLWNNLSIWSELLSTTYFNIDINYEIRGNLYGNILENKVKEYQNINYINSSLNEDEFNKSIYIVMSNDFIYEDLATSIVENSLSYSNTNYNSIYNSFINNFLENDTKIICLSIRFGNREWMEQENGIIQLIDKISSNFKNIKFLIDGMNTSIFSETSSHANLDKEKELKFVYILQSKFGKDNIYSLVGVDLHLAISILNHCEYIISPWGAGLVKYKWLLNKKCIIYTSDYIVKNNPDLRIYSSSNCRENAIEDIFISGQVEENNLDGNNRFRGNYSLCWLYIYNTFINNYNLSLGNGEKEKKNCFTRFKFNRFLKKKYRQSIRNL